MTLVIPKKRERDPPVCREFVLLLISRNLITEKTDRVSPATPELSHENWIRFNIQQTGPDEWKLVNTVDGPDDSHNSHNPFDSWLVAYLAGSEYIAEFQRTERVLKQTEMFIRTLAKREFVTYEYAREDVGGMGIDALTGRNACVVISETNKPKSRALCPC